MKWRHHGRRDKHGLSGASTLPAPESIALGFRFRRALPQIGVRDHLTHLTAPLEQLTFRRSMCLDRLLVENDFDRHALEDLSSSGRVLWRYQAEPCAGACLDAVYVSFENLSGYASTVMSTDAQQSFSRSAS